MPAPEGRLGGKEPNPATQVDDPGWPRHVGLDPLELAARRGSLAALLSLVYGDGEDYLLALRRYGV